MSSAKKNYYTVGLIFIIFFVISFLTNILGPIIPDIINSFQLSLGLAGFLPFSFFVAYGVTSIPAGILVEKIGEKKVMILSFGLATAGAALFAFFPTFLVSLLSLFIIGIGMAMLQVAINPLLRVSGGEEHFAFNSAFAQLIFGAASYISPLVYSYLVANLSDKASVKPWHIKLLSEIVPDNFPWISLYWVFSLVAMVMIIIISVWKFPRFELNEDEKIGAWETHKLLLKNKYVILFFTGIFCYVGTEQGVSNWISKFLYDYHGVNPQTSGAETVSYFWGAMTAGCLLGLFLLKKFDSRKVLIAFVTAAMICLTIGLLGTLKMAMAALPAVGFFLSVMFPIVISLALNSLKDHHGSFSGILCSGIIGGAIIPLIIGWVGNYTGLRFSLMILYLPLGYLLSIGFWAKPLIKNATY